MAIIELIQTPLVDNSFYESRSAELAYRVTGIDPNAGGSTNLGQLQSYVEGLVYDKVLTDYPNGFRHSSSTLGWPFIGLRSKPDGMDWVVTAVFSRASNSESSFSIQTESRHVVVSKRTIARYPDTAPNFRQMVGVVGDSEAEGVDIVVPVQRFSESRIRPAAIVTNSYVDTIGELTGTINNAPFMGRKVGEVLFMGADGQRLPGGDYRVTYEFAFQPNSEIGGTGNRAQIELQLGTGPVTKIAKYGWDYIWVHYMKKVVGTPPTTVRVPMSAHVEAMYSWGDFSLLNL
jgi:hypothetical protein